MAFAAVAAEAAAVRIVAAMTLDAAAARRGRERTPSVRGSMARVASEIAMRAREREVRGLVVIEARSTPVGRVVAGRARAREPSCVRIVVRVTVRAGALRVVESERRVAGLAVERRVLAEQRERRETVVEPDRFAPRDVGVAAVAARAELAFVRIVLRVAARAIAAERRIDAVHVTRAALELRVCAAQRERVAAA